VVKRYSQWHHTTLRGDKDLAQRFVPLGRKLLGAIAEEMATTGNGQGKRFHRTPEGAVLIAQIVGAVPTLSIDVSAVSKRLVIDALDGFVVWPAGGAWDDGRDHHQLVLDPKKGPGYHLFSYDGADLPEGLSSYHYDRLFPTVGLKRAGNVDWTNAGETLSVTWYGPRSRYFEPKGMAIEFAYGYTRVGKVFCHGQLLLDIWEEPYATLLGMDWGEVTGAAIRSTAAGLVLIVALTYEDDDNDWHDVVFAVDLTGGAKTPIITAQADTARILATRPYGEDEDDDYQHPVFFNPDASEGRWIRDDPGNGGRVELIVAIAEDGAGDLTASFSSTLHPYPTISTASTTESTLANVYALRNKTFGVFERTNVSSGPDTYAIVAPEDHAVAVCHSHPFTPSNTAISQFPTSSTMTSSLSTEGDLVMAVDFRPDGTPSYLRAGGWTSAGSGSSTGSYTLEASDSLSLDSIGTNGTGVGGEGVDYSVSGTRTGAAACTADWINAMASSWRLTYGAESEFEIQLVGAYNETQTGTLTGATDASFASSFSTTSGIGSTPTADPNVYRGAFWYGIGSAYQASASADSASISRTVTLTASVERTVIDEDLVFLYADLRRDLVVYIRQHHEQTVTGTFADDHTTTDVAHTGIDHDFAPTADAVLLRQHTLYVELAGEPLFEHAWDHGTISETLTGEVPAKYDIRLTAADQGFNTYNDRCDTLNYNTVLPLAVDRFGTDGFAYADTTLWWISSNPAYNRFAIWPSWPVADGGSTPPDAEPRESSDSDTSTPDSSAIPTLWGQIAMGTLPGWPLGDSPEDADGRQGYGAWAFYQDRYCFSTPAPSDGFGGGWATRAKTVDDTDDLIDTHVTCHPIWVLPPVRPVPREARPGEFDHTIPA
jgi:hypothetical protein